MAEGGNSAEEEAVVKARAAELSKLSPEEIAQAEVKARRMLNLILETGKSIVQAVDPEAAKGFSDATKASEIIMAAKDKAKQLSAVRTDLDTRASALLLQKAEVERRKTELEEEFRKKNARLDEDVTTRVTEGVAANSMELIKASGKVREQEQDLINREDVLARGMKGLKEDKRESEKLKEELTAQQDQLKQDREKLEKEMEELEKGKAVMLSEREELGKQKADLEEVRALLEKQKDDVSKAHASVEELRKALQADKEAFEKEKNSQTAPQGAVRPDIEEREKKLAERGAALDAEKKELEQKRSEIRDQASANELRGKELDAREKDIDERKEKLDKQEVDLDLRQQTLSEKEVELRSKESVIDASLEVLAKAGQNVHTLMASRRDAPKPAEAKPEAPVPVAVR